jgi:radical SAM protein with 4Fe4S-binding SPASM domain
MVGHLRTAVKIAIDLGADIVSITPPILKAANAATQDYRQDLRAMHKAELDGIASMTTPDCLVMCNSYWFDVIEGDRKPTCCDGIDFYTCIGPDARVYPCFRYWLNEEFSYGDLNHERFRDVWEGSRRQEVRRRVLEAGPDDGTLCRNCAHTRMNQYLTGIKNPSRFEGAI